MHTRPILMGPIFLTMIIMDLSFAETATPAVPANRAATVHVVVQVDSAGMAIRTAEQDVHQTVRRRRNAERMRQHQARHVHSIHAVASTDL